MTSYVALRNRRACEVERFRYSLATPLGGSGVTGWSSVDSTCTLNRARACLAMAQTEEVPLHVVQGILDAEILDLERVIVELRPIE